MTSLVGHIRRTPLPWLLAFVPVLFAAGILRPHAPTLLFLLSIHAIVTDTPFMLGASFLLGGLGRQEEEFDRVGVRFLASPLFIATLALLIPFAVADREAGPAVMQCLGLMLAVMIGGYILGLWFSPGTGEETFASATHGEPHEGRLSNRVAQGPLDTVAVLVAPLLVLMVNDLFGPPPVP